MRTKRKGAVLLEFALVLPIFLVLVLGMLEFAVVLFIRHSMLHAAREAARGYAIEEFTAEETQQLALDLLPSNIEFTVDVTPQDDTGNDRFVEISAPIDQASLGDPLNVFGAEPLSVRVTMLREN